MFSFVRRSVLSLAASVCVYAFGAPAAQAATVTLAFPSPDSTLSCSFTGPLGIGGVGSCFRTGSSLSETFVSTGLFDAISAVWSFQMSNFTNPGVVSTFDVLINGALVDSYSITGRSGPPEDDINLISNFAPIAGDTYTLSIVATSTVPPGGGSWDFFPGGSVILSDEPAVVPLPAGGLLLLGGIGALTLARRQRDARQGAAPR